MNNNSINKKSKYNIAIQSLSQKDLNSFMKLHFEVLLSENEFSKIYHAERFDYIINHDELLTVSAKNKEEEIIGIVYGGEEGYQKKMNKNIMKKIMPKLLIKPSLFFSEEFLYKYKAIFNRLITKIKRTKNNSFVTKQSIDINNHENLVLRLTGIGVSKKYQGLGIGKELLLAYESAANDRGFEKIILETPDTNYQAINFYERLGWKKYINENANPGKTYFYKRISNEVYRMKH